MEISPSRMKQADVIARMILAHLEDYKQVEAETGVPWHWIAAVHYREASLNFKTHLANGDPLGHPTVHVPRGLLAHSWPEGAVQALKQDNDIDRHDWSDFGRYCYQMEAYNGWGYRKHGVTSPYLWSGSNQHARGKFVRDGVYSPNAIDEQLGGLVILKALMGLPDTAIIFKDF